MPQVFIGLGSNLGDRFSYLRQALVCLSELKQTSIKKCSSVYETQPVGVTEQPEFLNMVVELESELPQKDVFKSLKEIETCIGRKHNEHWGPREIDLDLLYYAAEIFDDGELCVPHPEIKNRRFVLVPMNEIASDFKDPVQHSNVEGLLRKCPDNGNVTKINLPMFSKDKE